MTAQPLEADATPPPTPAQWLKTALAPRKRIMALASGLMIADAVPAVGFAAGLGLAVGALPQGFSHALPGAALAIASLLARGGLYAQLWQRQSGGFLELAAEDAEAAES